MATSGATHKLSILLSYEDRGSAGMSKTLEVLRNLDKQTKATSRTYSEATKAVERNKRSEVTATARAAREVERITAQTTRQAEQQARLRERIVTQSATRAATAQVREQRRASNEMIRLIDGVRREEQRSERRAGPGRAAQFARAVVGLRPGGGYGGYYGNPVNQAANVAHQTFDKIRGFTTPALEQVRAENRFQLLGDSKEDQAKAQAAVRKVATDVKGVRTVDVQELLIGLTTTMGTVSEAIELLPMAAKHLANVEAIYGDKVGRGEAIKHVTDATRAIELIGKDQDINETKRYLNFFAQATMATGGDIDPSKIKAFTKYGNIAAMQMSPQGWAKMLPVIQQMGGAPAGTALTSMYSAVVGGTIPKEKLALWAGKGLLDMSKVQFNKQGGVKKLLPGAIPMAQGMAEDPVAFSDRYAEYLRTKEKIDTADPANTEKIATNIETMFGNRTAKRQIAQMIIMRQAIRKETERYEKAAGIEGMYGHVFEPGNVLGQLLAKQVEKTDTAAAIGKPLAEMQGEIATALTPFYEWLRHTSEAHPHIAAASAATLSFGTSALTATDGVSRLTGAISAITGSGGGGVAGTGVGVSDIVTGGWAAGKGAKWALRGGLGPIGVGATALALGAYSAYQNYRSDAAEQRSAGAAAGLRLDQARRLREQHGGRLPDDVAAQLAASAIGNRRSLLTSLEPKTYGLAGYAGVGAPPSMQNRDAILATEFRRRMPEFQFPELMAGLIRDIRKGVSGGDINKAQGDRTLRIAELAFGESFNRATEETSAALQGMPRPVNEATQALRDMTVPASALPGALSNLVRATNDSAYKIATAQPAAPGVRVAPGAPGGRGFGFNFQSGTQPTSVLPSPRVISSAGRAGMTINSPITVNVPAGSRAADDPQQLASLVGAEVARQTREMRRTMLYDLGFHITNTRERA